MLTLVDASCLPLSAARAFAADAAPLVAAFVRHERPGDFLERLNRHIAEFEQALSRQTDGVETRVAATAAIDAAIDHGMNAVRRLDVIVENKFEDDPATLAAWTTVSHTERAPHSSSAAPTEPLQP